MLLSLILSLPPHRLPQDLRLGTANLQELNLENCGHLREVQLSEAGVRSLDGGGSGSGAPPKPRLVLRGCTALPEETRKRLRTAVLGAP